MKVGTSQPCRPLVEVLQGIEDHRHGKGLRYPLPALLSLCCAGMLCGCRSYSAIAQWGRECSPELARSLGFSVVTTAGIERRPGASTLFYVLSGINRTELEKHLGQWMEEVLATHSTTSGELEAVAVDGKTLRGSAKAIKAHSENVARSENTKSDAPSGLTSPDGSRQDVPGVHLLSAFSHRLGVTLGQVAVCEKGNEITAAPELLRGLMLEGRVITLDAMFTQRSIAESVVAKGDTTSKGGTT